MIRNVTGKDIIKNVDGNIDWMYHLEDLYGRKISGLFISHKAIKEQIRMIYTCAGKQFDEEKYKYDVTGTPYDDLPEEIRMIYTYSGKKLEEKLSEAVNSK